MAKSMIGGRKRVDVAGDNGAFSRMREQAAKIIPKWKELSFPVVGS